MLMKDINCLKKNDKKDVCNYSISMQNLKSLYYYNLENTIKKPLNKIKVTKSYNKGNDISTERNFRAD